ncbi:MAG: GH25 family lysozyme [Clostridiaceae bacterium]|nr:GH25 family lysozyme [Clostridiaceae bacterium]
MRRIISGVLACILLMTMTGGVYATETPDMQPTERLAEFIKEWEGFTATPISDYQGWSIGYGTNGTWESLPDTITEEEAEILMRQELTECAASVNTYLARWNVMISQTQFDALVSMTYNLGSGWMNGCRLATAIQDGADKYSDVEIADYFGVWCHADGEVLSHLVKRRLTEACLFLYGDYEGTAASQFATVRFNEDGGEIERDIAFYLRGQMYGTLPTATKENAVLIGWQKTDGSMLSAAEIAAEDIQVKAVWYEMFPADPGQTVTNPTTPTEPVTEPVTQPTTPWVNPYGDVAENVWYYSYVADLSRDGVIDGYPDGTFQPGGSVTLGEALKLILLAAGYPEQAQTGSHWASGYVKFAVEQGFLERSESGNLDATVTRLLIAHIAAAALDLPDDTQVSPFADTMDLSVLALFSAGIIEGSYEGGIPVYKPADGITRAEISAIIWRIRQLVKSSVTLPSEEELPDTVVTLPGGGYDPVYYYMDGSRMRYAGKETLAGIDVSSHNGKIDWKAVAESGVEFAFIRVGFRGYGEDGSMNKDVRFDENIIGAKAAGIKVGVYFYSQATNIAEAMEEADFVLDAIRGYEIDYPVVYDWEVVNLQTARTYGLDRDMLTACMLIFCERIALEGYRPMVYFNKYLATMRCDLTKLLNYDFWYAQYAECPTLDCPYQIWQYSQTGQVDGIDGYVDLNIGFFDYGN